MNAPTPALVRFFGVPVIEDKQAPHRISRIVYDEGSPVICLNAKALGTIIADTLFSPASKPVRIEASPFIYRALRILNSTTQEPSTNARS